LARIPCIIARMSASSDVFFGLGISSLPEAPTFRPVLEEWQDPLKYINDVVRPIAEPRCGIAKIIPPENWRPPFAIDRSTFKFKTRLQSVHQLQKKDTGAAAKAFWESFNAFQASFAAKSRLSKTPTVCGRDVDLHKLYVLVQNLGGYNSVTNAKSWRSIAETLEVSKRRKLSHDQLALT